MKSRWYKSKLAIFSLVLFMIFIVLWSFRAVPLIVIGTSMYPTINHGDVLIAINTPSTYEKLERGDIISTRVDDVHYIKRVVGLGGDTIEIKKGVLFVNGEKVDEPYLNKIEAYPDEENYPLVKVPEDHYFIMGDNRVFSSDSRELGVFHKDAFHRKIAFHWKLGEEDTNNGIPDGNKGHLD